MLFSCGNPPKKMPKGGMVVNYDIYPIFPGSHCSILFYFGVAIDTINNI
jgi:hypothetical protein